MNSGTILGVAGLFIGVLGIAIAIYEGRKYRGPMLAFQYNGFNLIRSYDAVFPEKIEVTFSGEKVPNLTHTQVVLWNYGRGPLTKNDISNHDPLFLGFGDDQKILQAEIVKRTSEPNSASISYAPQDCRVKIDFDFFDSKDGILVSLWHTNPIIIPKVSGTIINKNAGPFGFGRFVGPKPNIPDKEIDAPASFIIFSNIVRNRPDVMAVAIMVFGFLFTAAAAFFWVSKYFGIKNTSEFSFLKTSPADNFEIVFLIAGLLYFFMGLWMWLQIRRRFPKKLLPDEYQVAEGN